MLSFYYTILSPEICKKYNIKKNKKKENLFVIVNDLIDKFGDKEKYVNRKITEEDLYRYINNILPKPAEDELKELNMKKIYSLWNNTDVKLIQFE